MMLFFTTQMNRLFDRMWRLHGEQELSIVGPILDWTLPAGVEYDPHQDQFVDGAGDVVEVDWQDQDDATELVPFIPSIRKSLVELAIPGVVSTDSSDRMIVLKWSATTQTSIAAAWGVAIGTRLYRVREWQLVPDNGDTPSEIRVSLVEAD